MSVLLKWFMRKGAKRKPMGYMIYQGSQWLNKYIEFINSHNLAITLNTDIKLEEKQQRIQKISSEINICRHSSHGIIPIWTHLAFITFISLTLSMGQRFNSSSLYSE